MSERTAPVSVLVAWAGVVVGVPLATTAWLSTTIPDDPLRDAPRPVIAAEAGDAVDPAGPRSRAAMRRALDGLVVTASPGATPGYHLRVAALSTEVVLTDTAGVVRHRWTAERDSFGAPSGPNPLFGVFREAHLREDGGLYVLVEGVGVVALDRGGAFEWSARSKAHDHLAVLPDGHLLVLEAEVQPIPEMSRLRVYAIDSLVEVDPASEPPGKSVRRVDLLKVYRQSEVAWQRDPEVNVLFGAAWFELAPDGTCHVALRERGTVAVLDLAQRRLVREDTGPWAHVGPLRFGPEGARFVVDHGPGAPMVVWGPGDAAAYTVDTPYEPSAPGWLQLLPSGHALVSPGVVRELDPGGAVVYAVDSRDDPPLGVAQDEWLPPGCCAWLDAEAP